VKKFKFNSICIFDFNSLTCQSLSNAEEIRELFGDRKSFFEKVGISETCCNTWIVCTLWKGGVASCY
jgi:hypothetical protein